MFIELALILDPKKSKKTKQTDQFYILSMNMYIEFILIDELLVIRCLCNRI